MAKIRFKQLVNDLVAARYDKKRTNLLQEIIWNDHVPKLVHKCRVTVRDLSIETGVLLLKNAERSLSSKISSANLWNQIVTTKGISRYQIQPSFIPFEEKTSDEQTSHNQIGFCHILSTKTHERIISTTNQQNGKTYC